MHDRAVTVSVHHAGDDLTIDVRGSAPIDPLQIGDRVGALGGRLTVEGAADGTTVTRVQLPYGRAAS